LDGVSIIAVRTQHKRKHRIRMEMPDNAIEEPFGRVLPRGRAGGEFHQGEDFAVMSGK